MGAERRLEELGLVLPPAPQPRGSYVPAVVHGALCFIAGQLPFDENGEVALSGKLGREVSVEQGQQGARLATLNALAAAAATVGRLDAIERVVRVTGYVNSSEDFAEQHLVVNGASDLLRELFGDQGTHARTSIGVNALPLGAAVEVELVVAVRSTGSMT